MNIGCFVCAGCCDTIAMSSWGRGPYEGPREIYREADTWRPRSSISLRVCLSTSKMGAPVFLLGKYCTACFRQSPSSFHFSTSHPEPLLGDSHTLLRGMLRHLQSIPWGPLNNLHLNLHVVILLTKITGRSCEFTRGGCHLWKSQIRWRLQKAQTADM